MKSHDDKCHLLEPNANITYVSHLNNEFIESEESVELLGVQIDEHVTSLLKKGNQKLNALSRNSKFCMKIN